MGPRLDAADPFLIYAHRAFPIHLARCFKGRLPGSTTDSRVANGHVAFPTTLCYNGHTEPLRRAIRHHNRNHPLSSGA